MLDVVHDAHELVSRAAVYVGLTPGYIAAGLPQAVADRCRQADVSAGGVQRLQTLLAGI